MGSTEISKLGFRESWAFIGAKGDPSLASEQRRERGEPAIVTKEFLATTAEGENIRKKEIKESI